LNKQDILDQSFELDNSNLKELQEMKTRMSTYMADNEEDCQLFNALKIIEIKIVENTSNDFEKACEAAQPIFQHLDQKDDWDLNDLWILSNITHYAETYMQAHNMILDAIEALKNIPDQGNHAAIVIGFHMDMLLRLVRDKFYSAKNARDFFQLEEIVEIFGYHYEAAEALCQRNGFSVYNAIANIRKGIFTDNNFLLNGGFSFLDHAGETDIHRIMKEEADAYVDDSKPHEQE
jgi:hypothetical protein